MSIYKATWTSGSTGNLVTFLNTNKTGTFLEGATINYDSNNLTLTISKGGCTFEHLERTTLTSADRVLTTFTTPTGSDTFKRGAVSNASASFYPVSAILCNNGLILNFYHTEQTIVTIGDIILTRDSNDGLSMIRRNADYWINVGNTKNLRIFSSKSTTDNATTLTLSPGFGLQKTGLIPCVINTTDGNTTLPAFYTALQTQLPALGLQSGRMDATDYITDGYCFIRDE